MMNKIKIGFSVAIFSIALLNFSNLDTENRNISSLCLGMLNTRAEEIPEVTITCDVGLYGRCSFLNMRFCNDGQLPMYEFWCETSENPSDVCEAYMEQDCK